MSQVPRNYNNRILVSFPKKQTSMLRITLKITLRGTFRKDVGSRRENKSKLIRMKLQAKLFKAQLYLNLIGELWNEMSF